MKELIIGILITTIAGITGFAWKNPISYCKIMVPPLLYIGNAFFISYSSYLLGKSYFGPNTIYLIIACALFNSWVIASEHIHKLKD